MPIDIPPMPPAVAAALATGLPKFAVAASAPSPDQSSALVAKPSITRSGRTISRAIESALVPGAAAGVGAPMTVLGLDELADGTWSRKTKPRLWVQLLPAAETRERAMAEVDQKIGKLTAVSEGPEVKALAKRIEGLTSQRTRSTVQQELALIRVPALHLTAVWLKGAAGEADDVVIPNDGPIAPLVPGQRYALDAFRRIVTAMATERLARTRDDMGG